MWSIIFYGIVLVIILIGLPILMVCYSSHEIRIKKRYFFVYLGIHRVPFILLILHIVLYSAYYVYGLLVFVLWAIDLLFWILVRSPKDTQVSWPYVFLAEMLVLAVVFGVLKTWTDNLAYEHVIMVDYKLAVEDESVTMFFDHDVSYQEMSKVMKEVAGNLTESNTSYCEGNVEIIYKCYFPIINEEHDDKCSCSNTKVCDFCQEYVMLLSVSE